MKITLQPKEKVIRHGLAFHFIGPIGHTGKLYLTNQRLFFTTHPLNFRQYDLTIVLSDIHAVEMKNFLRVFSKGIIIRKKNGHRETFSVWKRKRWKRRIERLLKR